MDKDTDFSLEDQGPDLRDFKDVHSVERGYFEQKD